MNEKDKTTMLENHMVLNTPDAPWNAPDATGTCDTCHETADTSTINVNGIEEMICGPCDEARLIKLNHKFWGEQLRGAGVGDVIVATYKTYRVILSVTQRYQPQELWGHSMQTGYEGDHADGKAYNFNLNASITWAKGFPDNLIDIQVVSL